MITGLTTIPIAAGAMNALKAQAEKMVTAMDDPDSLKVIVVKDTRSKSVLASAVPQKCIDQKPCAVDAIVESVLWLGYSRVIFKSDNEPFITKLLQESLAALKVNGIDQSSEDNPPPYDPQENEAVSVAVKQLKARLNTLNLCLERRLGQIIPPKHPITVWLAAHRAALIRYRARGVDGKTPPRSG